MWVPGLRPATLQPAGGGGGSPRQSQVPSLESDGCWCCFLSSPKTVGWRCAFVSLNARLSNVVSKWGACFFRAFASERRKIQFLLTTKQQQKKNNLSQKKKLISLLKSSAFFPPIFNLYMFYRPHYSKGETYVMRLISASLREKPAGHLIAYCFLFLKLL